MFSKTRVGCLLMTVFIILAFLTPAALAVETRQGDSVYLPPGLVKGPLFVTGNSVVVDADVDGDLFAAGQNIVINGKVEGDVLVAGQSVRVTSAVKGDIRAAGNDITIQSPISGNVTAAGNSIRLEAASRIGKDALLFGNSLEVLGAVDRQVIGAAESLRLTGSIGNDLKLWEINNLTLAPSAVVGGSLIYRSPQQAQIASGAKINGETRWEQSIINQTPPRSVQHDFSWVSLIIWFATGLVLWGFGFLLFPALWQRLAATVQEAPGASLGWGLLLLVTLPLIMLVFMITVIGIPLALIILFCYVLVLMLAKVILGDILGRYLLKSFKWEGKLSMWLGFMLGFALVLLLSKIPIVGFVVSLVAACLALGTIAISIYNSGRGNHASVANSDPLP